MKIVLSTRDGRRVDQHVTDQSDHFEFEQIPFGSYRVTAISPDGRTESQDVKVASGDVVAIELFLPLLGQEVVIEAERPKAPLPAKTAASASTLERDEIQSLPRGDTQSVNEILATQPGFVYDAMGNLFARGNHANIQYQIDGVPLPESVSGLFGGFLSPKLIDNMEVITGGLGAEYGERLAAVVNLNSRRPTEQGNGELELMGGSFRIPIDPAVRPLDPSKPDGGRSVDRFGNPPAPFFPSDTDSTENERDTFALLSLRHDFNPRTAFRAALSYRHSYGFLFGDAQHALGPTQDPCTTDAQGDTTCASASDVGRTADRVGLHAEQLLRLGEDHVVKLGTQWDQLFGSTNYTSYTRSDALQGPDPAQTALGNDTSRATTGGAYLQERATFGGAVVNAGVRFDLQAVHFLGSPSRATQVGVSPRLGVAYALTPTTVAHAFVGLLWQPPPVLDTPAAARILGVVPPTQAVNYDLLPEKDRYAEVGIESRLIPELSVKLTAWGRLSDDQLDDIGVGSTNLVSPYNFREGRAGGVEAGTILVLGGRFNAFANVSLEKAQGRGIKTARYLFQPDDLANENWQTLDHSQTRTVNTGATVRQGTTQLSGLLGYASGLRTGPRNNQHVPGYVRVDLSLSHQFAEVPMKPTVALDVVNVFDAHYAYRIANGFNGSHFAPGRSAYLRVTSTF